VLTVDLALPDSKYPADAERARYYEAVLDDLRALPGVGAAGLVQHLPLGGVSWNGSFEIEGRGQSGEMGVYAHYRVASAGYVEAMGIPVLRGRAFDVGDRAGSAAVALVNRSLAERVWPGEDPVGKRIRDLANEPAQYREEWLTVVGVVGDVRHGGLLAEVPPELYVNVLQRPDRAVAAVVAVRADVPPAHLIAPVRERIAAVDADVPAAFATMSTRLQESVANRRFTLLVLSVFAAGALVLAALGIYGVVAYTVARRRREIGVRLALGGDARRVMRWVVGRVLGLAVAGLLGGLALAAAGTRLLGGLLHGITAFDPLSFAGAAAVLLVVALVAAYLPARRAARVDPMVTLRAE
jgi:putative ABC transport system permease protein